MNAFALVWYALLAGSAYLLYEYYVLSDGVWRNTLSADRHHPAYDVLLTSLLYLNIEVIQFALRRIPRKRRQLPMGTGAPDAPRQNAGVHVVIAAHRAFDSLTRMLPSVLAAFASDAIWIADNGTEQDARTQVLCQELGINYRFYPVPNKANALFRTAAEIYQRHHDDARALVLLDDDTRLPEGFFVRHDLLEQPLVAGYCVGIAIEKTAPYNLLEHLVDFEYRTISYRNENRARWSTLPFLHGICAVYNTRRMLMIYSKSCTLPHGLPFGEDSFAGVDCRLAGYRLLQDDQNLVHTFCPRNAFPRLCGKGREQGFGASSLWKQRVLRWYLSWPRRLPSELALGLCYDTGTWVGNVVYRVDLAWYGFIVFVASFWPVYLLHLAATHQSWTLFGYLHLCLYATAAMAAGVRYAGFSPALKEGVNKSTILLVPLFNAGVCVFMACSFLISLLHYIPFRRIDYKKCYAIDGF